ncbi:hypothetical protein TEA_026229 [Camellia sinensis var. sinensis]|uniref:PUM-HD domain-containing protein n=1 Tax=Camellia sinensis var. sinensis TaxID=542762 RepID=A0A4S4ENC3_CAMSN|nr:hypothetical protein TEA_026229 [Camellia sinensis var. sinensis]
MEEKKREDIEKIEDEDGLEWFRSQIHNFNNFLDPTIPENHRHVSPASFISPENHLHRSYFPENHWFPSLENRYPEINPYQYCPITLPNTTVYGNIWNILDAEFSHLNLSNLSRPSLFPPPSSSSSRNNSSPIDPYYSYSQRRSNGFGGNDLKNLAPTLMELWGIFFFGWLRISAGNYVCLFFNKYNYNVVEKCLKEVRKDQAAQIIKEIINNPNFLTLVQDPYGNYVAQSTMMVSKGCVRQIILTLIQKRYLFLHNHPCGKRVLTATGGTKQPYVFTSKRSYLSENHQCPSPENRYPGINPYQYCPITLPNTTVYGNIWNILDAELCHLNLSNPYQPSPFPPPSSLWSRNNSSPIDPYYSYSQYDENLQRIRVQSIVRGPMGLNQFNNGRPTTTNNPPRSNQNGLRSNGFRGNDLKNLAPTTMELRGITFLVTKDKRGCLYLQKKIGEANPEEIEMFFELKDQFRKLMASLFSPENHFHKSYFPENHRFPSPENRYPGINPYQYCPITLPNTIVYGNIWNILDAEFSHLNLSNPSRPSLFLPSSSLSSCSNSSPIDPYYSYSQLKLNGFGGNDLQNLAPPLRELRGIAFLVAKDKRDCLYLQKKIDEANPEEIEMLFFELKDNVCELMYISLGILSF